MTLAEEVRKKTLQLKQDFVDVKTAGYDSGYSVGYADGLANGGGGSQAVDVLPYVTSVTFENADMTDITEDITLHLEGVNSLASSFSGAKFGCKKLTVYISNKCTNLFRTFRLGSGLEEIELVGPTSQIVNFNSAFYNRQSLKRISGNLDFSSSTNIGLLVDGCTNLEEIYPVANTIKAAISFVNNPKLIPACVQASIDGLADLTGQTTQTITFHKDVVLTEEQKATITLKNWTLVQ